MRLPRRFHMKGPEGEEPHTEKRLQGLSSSLSHILISLAGGCLTTHTHQIWSVSRFSTWSANSSLYSVTQAYALVSSRDKRGSCFYSQQVGKIVTTQRDLRISSKWPSGHGCGSSTGDSESTVGSSGSLHSTKTYCTSKGEQVLQRWQRWGSPNKKPFGFIAKKTNKKKHKPANQGWELIS